MAAISDFEVVKLLGRQNVRKFNEVSLVKNLKTGILGVKKKLIINAKNEHLVALLRQESELNFNFPGLPHTLAYEETDSEIILIRSYLSGVPLDEFWKTLPKSKRSEFLSVLIKNITLILNELSRLSVVHCDIKPTNILITQDWDCSLIDFGMSIQKQKQLPRRTLFALGYSAPELILNELELVNATTDIFALGITIWQLFTGELPLRHPHPAIMTNLQITHPLPSDRSIPKDWMDILQKMCHKHQFNIPPSHMNSEDVKLRLKSAMNLRYQRLEEITKDIESTQTKKKWFEFWRP